MPESEFPFIGNAALKCIFIEHFCKGTIRTVRKDRVYGQCMQQLSRECRETAAHNISCRHRDILVVRSRKDKHNIFTLRHLTQYAGGFRFLAAHDVHIGEVLCSKRIIPDVLYAGNKINGLCADLRQMTRNKCVRKFIQRDGCCHVRNFREADIGGDHARSQNTRDLIHLHRGMLRCLVQCVPNGLPQLLIMSVNGRIANADRSLCFGQYAVILPQKHSRVARPGINGRNQHERFTSLCGFSDSFARTSRLTMFGIS